MLFRVSRFLSPYLKKTSTHKTTNKQTKQTMALGPFARIITQVVVGVVAVLGRAIPKAYGEALQNARKAGVTAENSGSAAVLGKRISRSEALQVLNLTEKEATPEAIQKVKKKEEKKKEFS